MENKNGVTITDFKLYGHCAVDNASCYCGKELIVAAKRFTGYQDEKNLTVVCTDFGHARFNFNDLVEGKQLANGDKSND